MEIGLFLIIIAFIVAVWLIFKFVKKLVFAVFMVILLFVLVIGSMIGLVYLDYQYFSSKQDFDVNILYGSLDNDPEFGLTIPVENQELDEEDIKSFNTAGLDEEAVESDEENFYIFISRDFYDKKILVDNNDYLLLGTQELNVQGVDVDATLTKEEVEQIYAADEPVEEFVEILIDNNDLEIVRELELEDVAIDSINEQLEERNLELEEALFISTISTTIQEDNTVAYDILEGYKEGEIEFYPDRFSLSLLKYAPIGLVEKLFPQGVEVEQEE